VRCRAPLPSRSAGAVAGDDGPDSDPVGVGVLRSATPLGFWWLDTATVYALGLALVAAVDVGFAVADGRVTVIAVESGVVAAIIVFEIAAGLHFR
jgi:hypothetical protein